VRSPRANRAHLPPDTHLDASRGPIHCTWVVGDTSVVSRAMPRFRRDCERCSRVRSENLEIMQFGAAFSRASAVSRAPSVRLPYKISQSPTHSDTRTMNNVRPTCPSEAAPSQCCDSRRAAFERLSAKRSESISESVTKGSRPFQVATSRTSQSGVCELGKLILKIEPCGTFAPTVTVPPWDSTID
jgi:hypothetical protein